MAPCPVLSTDRNERVHLGNQSLTLAISYAELNVMTSEADLNLPTVEMLFLHRRCF